jgi:hypothetical protein
MRTVLLIVAVAALSSSCSREATGPARIADGDSAVLLHKRVWLDEEPKRAEDRFHLMVFDKEKTGIYQDRTVWKGEFELFRYKAENGGLVLKLPGSKKVVKTGFKIEQIKRGQADVRLTLDQPAAGPKVYWGYKFDDHADAHAWVDARFGAAE